MSAFSDPKHIELRKILTKIALRKLEGLRLYKPMPFQQAFHESMALERIIRGGNRAGKTFSAAVEIARAVTGQDPLNRYPKRDGICYCVAKENREVAQVLQKYLLRPGAFRMIRDQGTNEWRAFDPSRPDDEMRENETRPASPLIPKRFISHIAWENKKESLPKIVFLTNGWQIHLYSSNGKPTRGTAIHLAWFDEEILDSDWYAEVAVRLVDNRGRFIWSATPQTGTERLFALHERAEAQGGVWIDGVWTGEDRRKDTTLRRTVEEFFCVIDTNKHLTAETRQGIVEKFLEDEENTRVRIGGEFAVLSGRVFPEYSPRFHEILPFTIPDNWTRYVSIDSGMTVCGVLFAAVPPPEEGDFVYLYDELHIKNCTASVFGKEMARKKVGQTFQAFLIDMRGARQREAGYGKKIVELYSEQLRENNVRSNETGFEFIAGNDNIKAGIEAIRFWLRLRADGTYKLRVFCNMYNFIKEMKHYRNQQRNKVFIDKPVDKNDHLLDPLRYLAQYNPTWVAPRAGQIKTTGIRGMLKKLASMTGKKEPESMMFGPGGSYGSKSA